MAASETSGKAIPCGFMLLPDKKKTTYETIFAKIKVDIIFG